MQPKHNIVESIDATVGGIEVIVGSIDAIINQLGKVKVDIRAGENQRASELLYEEITPRVQQLSHDVWLLHHKSGTRG